MGSENSRPEDGRSENGFARNGRPEHGHPENGRSENHRAENFFPGSNHDKINPCNRTPSIRPHAQATISLFFSQTSCLASGTSLAMTLRHGDIVVMHGNEMHVYYEVLHAKDQLNVLTDKQHSLETLAACLYSVLLSRRVQ